MKTKIEILISIIAILIILKVWYMFFDLLFETIGG